MPTGSGHSDDEPTGEEVQAPRKRFALGRFSEALRNDRRARVRFALAGAGLFSLVVAFAACGGCGRRQATTSGDPRAGASGSNEPALSREGMADASIGDPLLWSNAKDGDAEDFTTLAAHEGAAGLVEAAERDPMRRATAIRAMGYARGWAQLPFLAKVAGGKDDADARLALDAMIDLAGRPRVSEDVEDVDELREGCDALLALARDAARPRARRVATVRSLRMMPCPKAELPVDVDAK